MNRKKFFIGFIVISLVIISFFLLFMITPEENGVENTSISDEKKMYDTFTSKEEFQEYLAQGDAQYNAIFQNTFVFAAQDRMTDGAEQELSSGEPTSAPMQLEQDTPQRVSETNVQISGIDEPDILKTDGESFFYSDDIQYYYPTGEFFDAINPPREPAQKNRTAIIDALPATDIALTSSIAQAGDLLLHENTLVVISPERVVGYDVSDRTKPVQVWEKSFAASELKTARLYNGTLYLVLSTWPDREDPCPTIVMRSTELENDSISCDSIYHPENPQGEDNMITLLGMDMQTGKTQNSFSTIAHGYESVFFFSKENMYIADPRVADHFPFLTQFILEESQAKDLFSDEFIQGVKELERYTLSKEAKMIELEKRIAEEITSSTDPERTQKDFEYAIEEYYKKNRRNLESTSIIKVSMNNFQLTAQGSVPGVPLNQFALDQKADESDDFLRVATTIGLNQSYSEESVSDITVLDAELSPVSSVQDLGKGEKIYAVRFFEDLAYVVTFKEVDPFYVIDMKDPKNPQKVGELKIPGFSSYLHPLTENLVLGVGQEDFSSKIALFDVSDPTNPTEVAKEIFDAYSWSEVEENHHAFLQDSEKEVFFLPVGNDGKIYSYANNTLTEIRTIENKGIKRAAYINDYFYLFGESLLQVYDQNSWEKIQEQKIND